MLFRLNAVGPLNSERTKFTGFFVERPHDSIGHANTGCVETELFFID